MKKTFLVVAVIMIVSFGFVAAITQQESNEAKKLIDSKAGCKELSDQQLELLGEYYMEEMHPGQSHEAMHQMMGLKEGSEAEEQFHISMAKRVYCGENTGMMSGGMMGMMNGNSGYGMMNGGMMGNYGYGFGYWSFVNVLYIILLIGLVILVWLWIIKLWRNMGNKGGKK